MQSLVVWKFPFGSEPVPQTVPQKSTANFHICHKVTNNWDRKIKFHNTESQSNLGGDLLWLVLLFGSQNLISMGHGTNSFEATLFR